MAQKGKGDKKSYRKLKVRLKPKERKKIKGMLSRGRESVRVLKRAQILLILDQGKSAEKAAEAVGVTPKTARKTGWKHIKGGLSRALEEPSRPGKTPRLNSKQKQRVIAMVCSTPPAGFARWSVRLIAEEAVKRKLTPKVGRETIRVLLKSHDLKPWREKNVVHS